MKKILLLLLLTPAVHGEDATARLSAAEQEKIWQEAQAAAACFPPREGDDRRALALYQQLAAGGHAKAMSEIGQMYLEGRGVNKDYAKAKEWYEKAIAAGDPEGYWWLARLYKQGRPGLERNYATAKRYYEQAVAAGDSDGYWLIGQLYEQGGPGLEQDYAAAKRWYEQAIATGYRHGYRVIGDFYEQGGPGLERNYASAKEWFEMAGDAGRLNGYGWVGKLYEEGGPGLEKDLEQACRYYQKASPFYVEEAKKVCPR